MAASSQRTDRPCKMLAFALLLSATLFNGIKAQEEPVTVKTVLSIPRGDNGHGQVMVLPTMKPQEPAAQTTTATVTEEARENDGSSPAAPQDPADEGTKLTDEVQTDIPAANAETPAPIPPRGDGHINIPKPAAGDDVVCVSKDAVAGRNAVNLKLKASSSCKETQMKIASVLQELCGENCKLELYQEDNTDEILVSGKYVEADVTGMTNKFNNDNIKDKTDVEEAVTHWGKNSKLVLVSMLLAGLLLAALLTAGYYLKTHRKNAKGVRLAESFQVDEENQANTLVSVAPLPQEPLDKPIVNGESPPENGTNSTPTTNGHSATQTPVADTEM
ncbi:hematopoietic progenitor cell antigen CD34 [Melanotaenia boesemani]|uniref:hematopoietic progenitor cell antigen CD34 n=1 Tax=Melanotaenia boesemani TaxID=1250792 RepID=UPI001C043950|nr:hematopoietic progenitor cell antigen CD34 [Melanotaenia boesemani]